MMEVQLITKVEENDAGQDQREEIANCNIEEDQDKSTDSDKSPKSKRGRPPKTQQLLRTVIKNSVQPPRRESQRIKKIRQTLDYTPAKVRFAWSKQEKLLLLKCLDRHGEKNIKYLMKYLPKRTEGEIKSQMRMWKEFAKEANEKKSVREDRQNLNSAQVMLAKLDKWLEYFMSETELSCSSQFALSNTFLLIAEYGKFSPPNECQGIDFRGLYRALHCMLNGTPYYGLNQVTAKLLGNSFKKLASKLRQGNLVKNYEPYLLKGTPRKRPPKHYGRPPYRGQKVVPSNGDAIFQMPGLNPLDLPLPELQQLSGLNIDDSEVVAESSGDDNFSDDE